MAWERVRNLASVATIVLLVVAVAGAVAAGQEYLHAQELKYLESFLYFENRYDDLAAKVEANSVAIQGLADGQQTILELLEKLANGSAPAISTEEAPTSP